MRAARRAAWWARGIACAILGAALPSCDYKVPVVDIHAAFTLADATWFEEEQTLFFFYTVQAEQGLGPDSQLEVTYLTDTFEQPWTPIAELPWVHTHVPVDCGETERCGSFSLAVPI